MGILLAQKNNTTMSKLKKTISDIRSKYGNLDDPDYLFIIKTYDQNPYRNLIAKMSSYLSLLDITDINYDASFAFSIKTKTSNHLLMMSMVGKYAVLIRQPDVEFEFVSENSTTDITEEEKLILHLLLDEGFELVDESLLYKVVSNSENEDGEKLNVYHLLFSRV
ncbi:hypothetical protein SapgrDRAFT_1009 [Saprospira grandis DSM 2844]|uniref:Uncharacterized protein n=2 Tax=Saprospira TaxID=1007 RepID=J0NYY9_9BACT|nr:hypothetical protein SapgrDRAFT_1009 [Saprospira grandis DSM 2844]